MGREKFRGFIDGHPVHVGSDHQPLKWLLTLKSPAGRLVRWAMKLQSFNLQVSYTPGKANVLADSLSRPPLRRKPVNLVTSAPC
ncbi:Retrovirus-related Pol polyprotein from transposon 17.6 [Eumeta japonica]|uniref:Retrovirus-related Pol polyprotein from transposon 17.6 n=1 Tax=Eumeta variegata TaxID=151549 RepID=A0A4C1U1B4_EUMVA|nr:Retrovirus-related Pol polyprotein from transposon 17.6 [Eumeta japonica]